MAKKIKLTEITDMFAGMDVEALEGVTIEGDIEIDLGGLGGGLDPMLAAALGQESAVLAQHFARIAGMFGYPVGIGAGVFIVCAILSLLLASITVSSQTIKSALTNPADSLKYE